MCAWILILYRFFSFCPQSILSQYKSNLIFLGKYGMFNKSFPVLMYFYPVDFSATPSIPQAAGVVGVVVLYLVSPLVAHPCFSAYILPMV